MKAGGELKVSDIARLHGISRMTAYRWLVELEKKYGSSVVGRRGKRGVLFTTEDAIAAVAPLARGLMSDIKTRLGAIEEKQEDAAVLATKTAQRVSNLEREFRQLSLQWFEKKVRRAS